MRACKSQHAHILAGDYGDWSLSIFDALRTGKADVMLQQGWQAASAELRRPPPRSLPDRGFLASTQAPPAPTPTPPRVASSGRRPDEPRLLCQDRSVPFRRALLSPRRCSRRAARRAGPTNSLPAAPLDSGGPRAFFGRPDPRTRVSPPPPPAQRRSPSRIFSASRPAAPPTFPDLPGEEVARATPDGKRGESGAASRFPESGRPNVAASVNQEGELALGCGRAREGAVAARPQFCHLFSQPESVEGGRLLLLPVWLLLLLLFLKGSARENGAGLPR